MSWLSSGLCLMRLARPTAASVAQAAPWVAELAAELPALPPVGLIADLGRLLLGAAPGAAGALVVEQTRLRRALARYEEHLLGRLAAERKLDAAADALARLAPQHVPAAIALVVEHLLAALGYDGGESLRPVVARRHLKRPGDEILALGLRELRHHLGGAGGAEALAVGYEELANKARHARALLDEKLIFTLENLTVLRGRTQRLAAQQMVEVAEQLGRALPRRLRRIVRRRGHVQTRAEDESHYPTGGFSAISNSGSLENLVSSELVYMSSPADRERGEEELGRQGGEQQDGGEVDLFDVRYAEGELLFYTRDESAYSRNRRVITFALAADLVRARFKDAGLPAQRLVLALGLLLCAVRRLTDWLREEALELRVVFIAGKNVAEKNVAGPLAEERELATLLLREWIDKGVAEVGTAASLAEVVEALRRETSRAEVDLVTFGCSLPELPSTHLRPLRVNRVDLSRAAPVLVPAGGVAPPAGGVAPDGEGVSWQHWTDLAGALLQQLL